MSSASDSQPLVVCFGEILWDFLPDALYPGGAPFNVAYHLSRHGCSVHLSSAVGTDVLGDELRRRLLAWGIDTSGIRRQPHRPTGYVRAQLGAEGAPAYDIARNVAWDGIEPGGRTAPARAEAGLANVVRLVVDQPVRSLTIESRSLVAVSRLVPIPRADDPTLADIARLVEEERLPPVERWNPTHCGDSEMRIARDGTWFHQGSPIGRQAMVRLFSTILRREPDGGYVLVTPVEKLDIQVEDAPFVAVEMKAEGSGRDAKLAFRLNTGELLTAGPEHPLRFAGTADEPRPYLHVRGRLEALVARPVYYDLAELALENEPPGVWSDGAFFPVTPAAA